MYYYVTPELLVKCVMNVQLTPPAPPRDVDYRNVFKDTTHAVADLHRSKRSSAWGLKGPPKFIKINKNGCRITIQRNAFITALHPCTHPRALDDYSRTPYKPGIDYTTQMHQRTSGHTIDITGLYSGNEG